MSYVQFMQEEIAVVKTGAVLLKTTIEDTLEGNSIATAQYRNKWKNLEDAYVHQWTGCMLMMKTQGEIYGRDHR